MKKVAVLLSLVVLFAVSCAKSDLGTTQQVSNVSSTPCKQDVLKSSGLSDKSDKVDIEFTNKGIQITHYNFEVPCDFTTVNVTHTLVSGVLRITQQGFPNEAKCVCHSDVSYTIDGILQNEVNVIFINGVQVYCHNDNTQSDCDPNVIIDADEYFNVPEFRGAISNLKIEGNNLKFTIIDSGCDGSSWVAKLITTGAIEKSLPPQRTIQLSFVNLEVCDAIVYKEFSFNIECLQVKGYNKVQLNIAGNSILYEYGDEDNQSNCDQDVIISQREFENAPNEPVSIIEMKIEGDCLKIKFGASGCSGNSWVVRLIDSGIIAESLPVQRTLKLSLNNREACAAYFTREMSFNIKDLQVRGNNSVQLNVLGKPILYEY